MFFNTLQRDYETTTFTPEEFELLNGVIRNNSEIKSYVDNAFNYVHNIVAEWNGHGLQIPVHLVENYILRHILNGLKGNKIPSDIVTVGETREYIHPNNIDKINAYGKYEIDRNELGYIISFEEPSKRKTEYLEIDNVAVRYKSDKYKYVIDTKFTELLPEEQNKELILSEEIDRLKENNLEMAATIDGLNKLLNLSNDEKNKLKDTISDLDNVISQLNGEMSKQADIFSKTLKEQSEASKNSLKSLTDSIQNEIKKNQSQIDKLEDDLKSEKAKREAEEAKRKNDENNNKEEKKKETSNFTDEDLIEKVSKKETDLTNTILDNVLSDSKLEGEKIDIKINNRFSGYENQTISQIVKDADLSSSEKQELLLTKTKQEIEKVKLKQLLDKYNKLQNEKNSISNDTSRNSNERFKEIVALAKDMTEIVKEIENLLNGE